MNDLVFVQVSERIDHLADVVAGLSLLKPPELPQNFVELPTGGVLEDVVDLVGVLEEAVHPEDVGVLQVGLDLDLAADLGNDSRVKDLLLAEHLQCYDKFANSFACEIDVAEPKDSGDGYLPVPKGLPISNRFSDH